ncbi:MAG TPA: hypothetical protein VD973_19750, partial [Symbiobacteriaceae bacterium]|nr:hypothetical protein [Symbiobacteriaceae bacterium]
MRSRFWLALVLGIALLLTACSGSTPQQAPASTPDPAETPKQEPAKTWAPEKQVTLIVPYSAGGSTDLLAR